MKDLLNATSAFALIATALTLNVFANCGEQTNVTKCAVADSCNPALSKTETRKPVLARGKLAGFRQGFLNAILD